MKARDRPWKESHNMEPKAIVYTSNTGYTAQYAALLAKKTGLRAYAMNEAMEKVL